MPPTGSQSCPPLCHAHLPHARAHTHVHASRMPRHVSHARTAHCTRPHRAHAPPTRRAPRCRHVPSLPPAGSPTSPLCSTRPCASQLCRAHLPHARPRCQHAAALSAVCSPASPTCSTALPHLTREVSSHPHAPHTRGRERAGTCPPTRAHRALTARTGRRRRPLRYADGSSVVPLHVHSPHAPARRAPPAAQLASPLHRRPRRRHSTRWCRR